ncbi:Alcohol dehydrogenase superfamily, zinc-type [Niveomyces insectorum RCEF 264]|uniref:Alcohol dehydrogenase superfamily, zinc-type n=1 Tax=Niveomyces insectorum RCEF 264 TaxID=1081102 RepID=A0A167Y154_9HYPO|nr:Alcohol dehydrogenase superfamily, zinc-type [Niveomyces insectorum RCEF 264]
MQAVQVVEYHKPYRINTVPVPKDLGPYDLLVKIAVASYCHTDGMVVDGVLGGKLPITASHEGAGTVVAVGSAVAAAANAATADSNICFRVGDRVMCGMFLGACGRCVACTTGPECERQYCTGGYEGSPGAFDADGYFAAYARTDARWTTHLPDAVSFLAAAPLACAGRTVWRAVQKAILKADLKPGAWLAIVGAGGGLGHLGIQFARAAGLRVVGIDARDAGLQAAREAGAEAVLDARTGQTAVVAAVRVAMGAPEGSAVNTTRIQTGDGGADATLLLSDAPTAAALACAVTRIHGTVVVAAQPDTLVIPFQEIVMRDVQIVGTLITSPGESQAMVDFIAKHGVHVQMKTFDGLDQIEALLHHVHTGAIKGKAGIIVDAEQLKNEKVGKTD